LETNATYSAALVTGNGLPEGHDLGDLSKVYRHKGIAQARKSSHPGKHQLLAELSGIPAGVKRKKEAGKSGYPASLFNP